ncbi:MAG TPA: hypothetical protein VJ805_07990 [Nitrospiraceae bacterium]|nr:hypothetical protein [Nitrospiraceae bacterium]
MTAFLFTLVISAFAVRVRSPPSKHACTKCPVSGKEASLVLSWDAGKDRLAIDTCDQKAFVGSRCHETCMNDLHASFPKSGCSPVIG